MSRTITFQRRPVEVIAQSGLGRAMCGKRLCAAQPAVLIAPASTGLPTDAPIRACDVALAEALGEKGVAKLLSETLEEEKQTDLKLTEVTQKAIMPKALSDDVAGEERVSRPAGRRTTA